MFDQTMKYNVQAVVVCGSCEGVVTTPDMVADTDLAGFGSYCAAGGHGYNATYSGLLLLPFDPDTEQIVANKKLKGAIFAHSLTTDTTLAPSEVPPYDLAAFIEAAGSPVAAVGSLYNVLGGLIAASTGVVSIVPDYAGFGQSSLDITKSLSAKLYRQSTIPLWLNAKFVVSSMTNGCTELDDVVTVGGYSEGGYASFAISQALDRIGVTILSCNSGAAAWDLREWLQWHLNDYDSGNVNNATAVIMAYGGVAFSSTDPDLANSNVGQNLLLDEWMDANNFVKNAKAWIGSDLSMEQIATFVPLPYYMRMLNPNMTAMFRNATAMNVSDACSLAVAGVTDKFCEVAEENDLSDDVAAPKFPVVVCHSPEDEIIPYTLYPDVSGSENLTEFSFLGRTATGSHGEAALFCFIPMILPFTAFNTGPSAIEQVPIETPDSCRVSSSSPTTLAGSPTMAPSPTEAGSPTDLVPLSTSSGCRDYVSLFVVLTSFVWIWNV